ncbi:Site-specific DNA recombinase [Nitrosospira briensis]|uniref:Site-specific DNA recombinase n=1 Tax=Nitrosospira briensis TaxID=35799 RepID=A0A1I4XIL9_9PROT|nr:recombinase family protein [Nitrosospira briensis]SFN25109.1 Site-specific DNA recombinase [Nitrosospira briensis]
MSDHLSGSQHGSASRQSCASRTVACAVYTRKSSEEGLEQSFNSIDAQQEACEAYIQSQRHEGWKALDTTYDDGGFSGGNMERPGLQQLMRDIAARKIRVVVVYKVDRLTRSLADFAKMVELFDFHEVSFVSVTQQFNTTTSMGRLTLNVLLSFAQFEREVTGERIRDKIAASKAKGMWMGGSPPMGYIPRDRSLVIDEDAARLVTDIFNLYLILGCVSSLKLEVDRRGLMTPARISQRSGQSGNRPFSRGHLYRILSNPIYIGQIAHKDKTYPGQHAPIIDRTVWDAVQAKLTDNRQGNKLRGKAKSPSLLAGLVWDEHGNRLTPSHSKKGSRRYRYYVAECLIQNSRDQAAGALRIPAHELEQAVIHSLIEFLRKDTDILSLLDEWRITDAHQVHAILRRAHRLAKQLEAPESITASPKQANDGKVIPGNRTHSQELATFGHEQLSVFPESASRRSPSVRTVSMESVPLGNAALIQLLQALVQKIIVGVDHLQISVRSNVILYDEEENSDWSSLDRPSEVPVVCGDAGSDITHVYAGIDALGQHEGETHHPTQTRESRPSLLTGSSENDQDMHTLILPVKLKRTGLAMRLIVPGQGIHRAPDPRLVQLLIRAYDWFDRLRSGKAKSMLAIANEEEITSSYVTRVIYLAFLAPDIVKAILQGQQPDTLSPDSLMRCVPLPIDWSEQRKLLGFVS